MPLTFPGCVVLILGLDTFQAADSLFRIAFSPAAISGSVKSALRHAAFTRRCVTRSVSCQLDSQSSRAQHPSPTWSKPSTTSSHRKTRLIRLLPSARKPRAPSPALLRTLQKWSVTTAMLEMPHGGGLPPRSHVHRPRGLVRASTNCQPCSVRHTSGSGVTVKRVGLHTLATVCRCCSTISYRLTLVSSRPPFGLGSVDVGNRISYRS